MAMDLLNSDPGLERLRTLRKETLETLSTLLHDRHLAMLSARFAEVKILFEPLQRLRHRIQRRPVEPFFNLVIYGASGSYKTTALGEVFPEIRDPWLTKDTKETMAVALSIEPSRTQGPVAFAHFYDPNKLRALVERPMVQQAHQGVAIQVETEADNVWRLQDSDVDSVKLCAPGGVALLDGELARKLTHKQHNDQWIELDDIGSFRARDLRFLVEKIQIKGRHAHFERLLGEHRELASRLHVIDMPTLETAHKDRDDILRVMAQRKPTEILHHMLEDDTLDVLVLFVRTGDEARLNKLWAEFNEVGAENVGLDNRLFIALTGIHRVVDSSIAQADKPIEKLVRGNILSSLGATWDVEPAGVCFIQSLEFITQSRNLSSPERGNRWNKWWSEVEPVIASWRDQLAALYPGGGDDHDANLRALADPADGGIGHLLRMIARHLARYGFQQKLDKHLVRGGLRRSIDQALDLLDEVFDENGMPRRYLLLGPAHRLRELIAKLKLEESELAGSMPDVEMERPFSDFLTGERASLRSALVELLASRLQDDTLFKADALDALVKSALSDYLEVAGPAEPPRCSTRAESRHWAILTRRYAAGEILHQLAGGGAISVGPADDPTDSAQPMDPKAVRQLRMRLTHLRARAAELADSILEES